MRGWRQGGKLSGWSVSNLSGQLGGLLHDMGCSIDLSEPDHVLALIADGPTASLACGWMEGDGQASFSNGERRAAERPFFKPVSLDPMLARLAVNLPQDRSTTAHVSMTERGFLIEASQWTTHGIDNHSERLKAQKPTSLGAR